MDILRSLEILKHKEDYIVPNSDMDEAISVAIEVLEKYTKGEKNNGK